MAVVAATIDDESLQLLDMSAVDVKIKKRVHDKNILVHAGFEGSPDRRYIVFTGSHNWARTANISNDEILVLLEDKKLYEAYRKHFDRAYNPP